MTRFTDNQKRIWKVLTFAAICRFYLERDEKGKWCIKDSPWWKVAFYYTLWINTSCKMLYLFFTYHGYLEEVHFLDQMSIWDWWLCASELVQEINIWYRKYPLYEVIHANWTIMEDVYRKLGSPKHIEEKIIKNDNQLQVMHLIIVFGGCFALMIQFFMNTKYVLNTYAIIPYDTFLLSCVMATHEYFFMFHCWFHQTFTVVLVEVYAVSYQHIIAEMTKVMYELIELGVEQKSITYQDESLGNPKMDQKSKLGKGEQNSTDNNTNMPKAAFRVPTGQAKPEDREKRQQKSRTKESKEENEGRSPIDDVKERLRIKNKYLDPATVVPGTEYDILTLVNDYKKITIAMNQFNAWVGTRMAGTDASSYAQFVSDVFMMIQLLKEPDVDFLGVFFFFEDACAGMVFMFRMLILQSRLMPIAEEFLHSLKCYCQYRSPVNKFLLKTIPSLRIVASKIGGYSVRPSTVPQGVNALMNFYISAAMWQRPKDRLT